jgi:tRNA U34 2-thiouridine synthase MnmA/TrmU
VSLLAVHSGRESKQNIQSQRNKRQGNGEDNNDDQSFIAAFAEVRVRMALCSGEQLIKTKLKPRSQINRLIVLQKKDST